MTGYLKNMRGVTNEGERLYFVVETKGSADSMELRRAEEARIKCGKEHFKAIKAGERPARYEVATSVDDLLKSLPD